ncbi:protein of unknown function [Fulvimarina manganoxydans]|uniref:DUF4336 domain-containing protein n=1 Tax=Fulvimarina manganoxydans TaxID=937218 RepID=A0A1W2AF19_9HYPH|nr:DUF4336 domain-containing protein [Fulvimarina manganoxydans]SMC59319.1 protein of unknown function [Fulvimarina manganoxydans]
MDNARLTSIGEGIWISEGELVSFYGAPYPTRSVVLRLHDGTLWIWSPIAIDPALRGEIDALGPVRHLVSPNRLHHLYLADWKAAYPSARLWGPQSVADKRDDLRFEGILTDTPPKDWAGEIDQAHFHGSPIFDEVVFFHHASKTAVIGDLIEAFDDDFLHTHWSSWQRWLARIGGITDHDPHAPLEMRLSFLRRAPAREAARKLFGWKAQRVVMAHGRWQAEGGDAYLRAAFQWLEA